MTDIALAHPNTDRLTAADAEELDQIAMGKRAAAVGTDPAFRAQKEAEARGLEQLPMTLRDPVARVGRLVS